jgi:hypothetical protein
MARAEKLAGQANINTPAPIIWRKIFKIASWPGYTGIINQSIKPTKFILDFIKERLHRGIIRYIRFLSDTAP